MTTKSSPGSAPGDTFRRAAYGGRDLDTPHSAVYIRFRLRSGLPPDTSLEQVDAVMHTGPDS